ncbi:inorganic diphosphatase [Kiloniella laminariae]|uniref:Inorganic pyrophosphatase n=1 Tax=Kiloniella laminariae TaxID=454162 RepID=A0ABT4LS33_9PROT|nr:inorganic diphosphatase [Kiloniella laminariae]MCZ4282747.1 inorganic diphosphatase [Kiloniella laminariae]
MDINKVSIGKDAPWDVNVVIEVPLHSSVKYELDKESGAIEVDRFLHTPMHYPCNYGFVPHTLSDDGDPADVLVVGSLPILPGAVIRVRPVGVLVMEDEAGQDEKILAVPVTKLDPNYKNIKEYTDLPENLIAQIGHFFEHYKDLESGKWVKVKGWEGADVAAKMIQQAIDNAAK